MLRYCASGNIVKSTNLKLKALRLVIIIAHIQQHFVTDIETGYKMFRTIFQRYLFYDGY